MKGYLLLTRTTPVYSTRFPLPSRTSMVSIFWDKDKNFICQSVQIIKHNDFQLSRNVPAFTSTGAASFACMLVMDPKMSWVLSLLSWNFTQLNIKIKRETNYWYVQQLIVIFKVLCWLGKANFERLHIV